MLNLPFNPKLIGIALVALALAGVGFYVWRLKSEIGDLHDQLKTVTEERDTARADVRLQNLSIEKMKQDSIARELAGKALIEQAQKAAQENKSKATVIYKTKPSKPGDSCQSALDLVNGSAK